MCRLFWKRKATMGIITKNYQLFLVGIYKTFLFLQKNLAGIRKIVYNFQ